MKTNNFEISRKQQIHVVSNLKSPLMSIPTTKESQQYTHKINRNKQIKIKINHRKREENNSNYLIIACNNC